MLWTNYINHLSSF